ncbi:MAG: MFS transporter [Solimonas sp.]
MGTASESTAFGVDQTRPSDAPLRRGTLFAFAMPALIVGFMHGPEGQIQAIYAKHTGLTLAALAGAILLTRMFDAITYPLIGYLSDRTFLKTGTRKAWLLVGTLISVVGMWFLYRPPHDVTIVYYGIWTAVTYLGWKVTEIPYGAWSFGLSREYTQRARIQVWRAVATLVGNLLFFSTPYLAMSLKLSATSELNLQTLGLTAILCAVCMPLASLIAVSRVPDGEAAPPSPVERKRHSLKHMLRSVLRNGPLLRLIAAFVPVSLLAGMAAGVSYLYVDTYLGLSEQFPALMLVAAPASILGVPLWGAACMRFERHRVWALSLVTGASAYACMGFVPVGEAALPYLMVLYPLAVLCLVGVVAVPAMTGDIVDYGRLQTGEDLSGVYASVMAFLQKSLGGVAAAAGLALVGWFGFDPTATQQTTGGVFGIRLVAVWLPAIGLASAAFIIWPFPLNRARLAEIRAELAARGAANPGGPQA